MQIKDFPRVGRIRQPFTTHRFIGQKHHFYAKRRGTNRFARNGFPVDTKPGVQCAATEVSVTRQHY